MDSKTKAGRKPQRPEHSQGVLLKALPGVAHAAYYPVCNIFAAVKRVYHFPRQGQGYGINGKIPSPQILINVRYETDGIRPAVVGVFPVGTESGDLHMALPKAHGDGPVLQPGRPGFGKQGHHLMGQGVGAYIPVMGPFAHDHIPDAAPNKIGPESGGLQSLHYFCYIFR